jgi:hypothetical protein
LALSVVEQVPAIRLTTRIHHAKSRWDHIQLHRLKT